MKVSLAKHGGLVAGISRPVQSVDTTELSKQKVKELRRLVNDTVTTFPLKRLEVEQGRDAMSYTITVEDKGHSTVLSQSDTTMSSEFAILLEWLELHKEAN